jgi:hypothetical protein
MTLKTFMGAALAGAPAAAAATISNPGATVTFVPSGERYRTNVG